MSADGQDVRNEASGPNPRERSTSPRRLRTLIAVVAALLVAAIVAAVGWGAVGNGGPSVRSGSGEPDEHARVLRLNGVKAGSVAISRSEEVKVWWRGRGAADWSAPAVVDPGKGRFLLWTSIRVAKSTIAIRASYSTKAPWDYDDDDSDPGVVTNVFVLCRTGSCTASEHYKQVVEPPCERGSCLLSQPEGSMTQVPELTPDGDQVYFGTTDRGYVVWSLSRGLRAVKPNHPRSGELGSPRLAEDGSLLVVSGRHERDRCRLTLLTSKPITQVTGALPLTEQVSTGAPTSTGVCATTLEAFTSDQLLVHTDRVKPAYLTRHAATWRPSSEDPTGLVRYVPRPGRHAAGNLTRTGFWHGREVAVGSPDGRRLVAQVHFPGEARWTDPITVAVAPRGLPCFEIAPTSTPAQDPFYVSMRCRYRPTPNADLVYVGVHAVSDDGRQWASAFGDQLPTRVGKDLFFGGAPAYRWTPANGLGKVSLPVPPNSLTFLVDDGTRVLVVAKPVGSRCELVVRVAPSSEARWSAPLPNPDPLVPAGEPCRPVGQYDGRVVSLYYPTVGGEWMPARVTRENGNWIVTARRRAG